MQVLVVEDDTTMLALLRKAIREEGHAVLTETNGLAALDIASSHEFDVIVLDVMLPGLDGFGVAKRLRQQDCRTPILMLTARDDRRDIIHGLNIGADDYLVKPFALDVFLARLKAVGRRGPMQSPVSLSVADLHVDTGSREVRRGKEAVTLTRTEYSLLELLMRRRGRVVSRENILETVWGFDVDVESNTLDAFVSSLRSKVDLPGKSKLIHTVRGVGYTLREES